MNQPSNKNEAITMPQFPSSITEDDVRALIAEPSGVGLATQPVVDLARGIVVGYETLARFPLASGRPSFPEEVFAAALRAGLGAELEATIVQRALQLAAKRPANCFLSINVDPHHVGSDVVLNTVARHGDLAGIIFELTKHDAEVDLDIVKSAASALRRRGALIGIDDCGAEYSGLKQIVELAPQFIKVDRDLVSGVHSSEPKRALVRMLGELASRLDAWIVAEGVETEAQLVALAQLQVPLVQGYALGKPAAPWTDLASPVKSLLHRVRRKRVEVNGVPLRAKTRQVRKTTYVAELVDLAPTCGADEEWPKNMPVSVRVNGSGRPIEMRLSGEEGARLRMEYDLLRVKVGSSVAEIALRVTMRPERLRWDPVIVIDDSGTFEGIVSPHRMMNELATQNIQDREVPVTPRLDEPDLTPSPYRRQSGIPDDRPASVYTLVTDAGRAKPARSNSRR